LPFSKYFQEINSKKSIPKSIIKQLINIKKLLINKKSQRRYSIKMHKIHKKIYKLRLRNTWQLQFFNAQFCTHFLPCPGSLTIFRKLAPDTAIYAQQSPKNTLPPGWRHIITLTAHTCLPPGFRSAQNIDLNPRSIEHSGIFKGFPLADARMVQCCLNLVPAHGCPLHQDVCGQGQPLFCFCGHLLVTCYLLHQSLPLLRHKFNPFMAK
jgi:hypothetical protein